MRLKANSKLLGPFAAPLLFRSSFPSSSSLSDPQVLALMENVVDDQRFATQGQALLAQAGAEAWWLAQGLANKAKMTIVGDLPSDWLPDVAWLKDTKYGEVTEGLFAAVAFPSLQNSLQFVESLADVGLESALNAINAVPIYGWIAKAVISFGRALYTAWTTPVVPVPERRYQLPWSSYVRDVDEDLINQFLLKDCGTVDWTRIFAPPTEAVGWTLAEGVEDGRVVGKIFAPLDGDEVAYANGLGVIPGSVRAAGLIQTRDTYQPTGERSRLVRYFTDGTAIPWAPSLVQTGDFRPALAQAGGQLWQQAQKPGSPDMFKIDARILEAAWEAWFDAFFSSVWSLAEDDELLGDLAAPYVVVERGDDVRLGIPWRQRPRPAPIVWPGIFDKGPARPEARNNCLWADIKAPREIRAGESQEPFWWPWHGLPEQAGLAPPYKIVDGHRVSGGPAATPKNKPLDWRCHVWPSGEEQLSVYRRPFQAIAGPALARLRELQFASLRRTLVCAYVRPEDNAGGERYAAFADPLLRARCFELRKQLLASPDRMLVDYRDAREIDPEYAQALAESGVPTTAIAREALLFKLRGSPGGVPQGQVDPGAPPTPPPLPPLGGVAFGTPDDDRPPSGGGGAGRGGVVLLGLLLGGLILKS